MNDPKLHFRAVLIDILDRLSANERKKLSFLLADDIERSICDDPTIGGTLGIFQQLFDRGKISEEDFTFLIEAFERIKCTQAAKSLRELQKTNVLESYLNGSSLLKKCMDDVEDKVSTRQLSHLTHEPKNTNKKMNMPLSHVSLITPIENTKSNHSRSYSADTENIDRSRGIYLSQQRLIWFVVCIVGSILLISATVGTIMYRTSIGSRSTPFSTLYPSTTIPPSSGLLSSTITNDMPSVETNDKRCQLPAGNSCTGSTPSNTKAEGLGVYYENPCYGIGCGFFKSYCRLCWIDPEAPGRLDRPQCPPCVSAVLKKQAQ